MICRRFYCIYSAKNYRIDSVRKCPLLEEGYQKSCITPRTRPGDDGALHRPTSAAAAERLDQSTIYCSSLTMHINRLPARQVVSSLLMPTET